MKIDIHSHCYPLPYVRQLDRCGLLEDIRERTGISVKGPLTWDGAESRLRDMAAAQIDLEVLSVSAPGAFFSDKRMSLALAQICNDSLAEICSAYPERFRAFITVPLTDVLGAIEELHRARRLPGMVGVALGSNIVGRPLDDPEFWPFYEELDRLRLPAHIHPMEPVGMPLARDFGLTRILGFIFETCVAASRLVLSGVREKYPNFPIILSHLGGALPFIANRIDSAPVLDTVVRQRLSQPPSGFFRQMYFDTALSYSEISMNCGLDYLNAGQIILGTDFPFARASHAAVVTAIEALPWPEETKEKIFYKNAAALLGL
ncbi:MAG: amidohydrolase family protein [Dehalococcoidia bacterium]|nr:amidohydrolase family protein [Dehalococcoidia bacterium]